MCTSHMNHSVLSLTQEPYVNQSAVSIQEKFSLHRTYIIFRTLGLRHLTVVDCHNRVVGILTRKDLMGYSMEERLGDVIERSMREEQSVVELSDHYMGEQAS